MLSSCIKDELVNPESTPYTNFDLLWELVDQKYCFMEYKQVNWDSIGNAYRSRLYPQMNDYELFEVCARMLAELKDGHVNLTSSFNRSRYWNWFFDYPPNFNENILTRKYLGPNYLIVGKLSAQRFRSVGYIRYGSFSDPLSINNIKSAVNAMGPIEGLIIDVRNNGGGALSNAEEFVSAFLKQSTVVAYTRYKQGPGHNDFSPFYKNEVSAPDTVAFDGPIVVLTNRMVYSAANAFVSFMKELPNVTHMGNVTGGGGGIPSMSELYNGWSVRFSTNPMFNARKEQIEWGVKPDVYVDMDVEEEINGIDTMLEEAIFFLSGSYFLKSSME
jgi:hypothetical protein